ncbi:MAG: phosphoribosylformylglycinamidine cyclo-ligase [Methylococcales bacterium]|nr:phosphoribosylformylglycinamidine cyclo-ligase [Methylococcales bacterium]
MNEGKKESLSYKDAGVDIEAGNSLVERIKPVVARTMIPGVLGGLGGFGSLFEIPLDRYRQPVLVSGTDGVGTKLKLAFDLGRHNTVGIDLVAMCINDILVQGAEPLYFLDYFATGSLDVDIAATVVEGIGKGCELSGAALVGGETAEMPGMYPAGEYDLAGFCVGIVEKSRIIDGSRIEPGDRLLGLASSGPHSNGYSLIRRILERENLPYQQLLEGKPVADYLIEPTRIYARSIRQLLQSVDVHGIAHITGGGITENLPRVVPDFSAAEVDLSSWPMPPIFSWLQEKGNVDEQEMLRTFNCGVGMVVCVADADEDQAICQLEESGEIVYRVGRVLDSGSKDPSVIFRSADR